MIHQTNYVSIRRAGKLKASMIHFHGLMVTFQVRLWLRVT